MYETYCTLLINSNSALCDWNLTLSVHWKTFLKQRELLCSQLRKRFNLVSIIPVVFLKTGLTATNNHIQPELAFFGGITARSLQVSLEAPKREYVDRKLVTNTDGQA